MPFHHKKPFDPSGDVYANSVTRTMKSQALSAWDMFTRETLQNSWDARDRTSQDDGVTFAIDFRELSVPQIAKLREDVFGNDFVGVPQLEKAFQSNQVSALCVSDAGTHGLRGPSRATAAVDGPTDFNSFIRNIGRSDSKVLAGGTYGFGKGVFFIASEVKTIVVYTRTVDENGNRVHRLIAMANADDFTHEDVAYTGRHWWGEHAIENTGEDRTEFAEPFTGEKADTIAHTLGMDQYFTEIQSTGTSIMILNPDLSVQETEQTSGRADSGRIVLSQIASSLTRWAWPHMLNVDTGMDPIDFSVSYNGEPLKIPSPNNDPALRHFVNAYLHAIEAEHPKTNAWEHRFNGRITTIAGIRPKKDLGVLSITDLPNPIFEEKTVIGKEISAHIATIRNPRMIVEYYKAPDSSTGKPFCGVFIADSEADVVFARSEPAAHHQWNHETIAHDVNLLKEFWGSTNNPVSIFFSRLKTLIKSADLSGMQSSKGQYFKAASELSDSLGLLLSSAQGGRGNRTATVKTTKRSQPSKPSLRGSSSTRIASLRRTQAGIITTFEVDISIPDPKLPTRVNFRPTVNSDSGDLFSSLEKAGAALPHIVNVTDTPAHVETSTEDSLVEKQLEAVIKGSKSKLYVDVFQPADMAISLNVSFDYNIDKNVLTIGGESNG